MCVGGGGGGMMGPLCTGGVVFEPRKTPYSIILQKVFQKMRRSRYTCSPHCDIDGVRMKWAPGDLWEFPAVSSQSQIPPA